jgi:hypothetical protein
MGFNKGMDQCFLQGELPGVGVVTLPDYFVVDVGNDPRQTLKGPVTPPGLIKQGHVNPPTLRDNPSDLLQSRSDLGSPASGDFLLGLALGFVAQPRVIAEIKLPIYPGYIDRASTRG